VVIKQHVNIYWYCLPWEKVEMARAANSPVFGQSSKGFETVR